MLTIDWRSPAAYKAAGTISAAGFAWEYLRRCDAYHQDYRSISYAKNPAQRRLEAFSARWDCDFPCDPSTPPDNRSQIWIPRLQPRAVCLSPTTLNNDQNQPIVTLAHLDDLVLRQAVDGWHGLWHTNGLTHQLWLPDAAPDRAAFYVFQLPSDRFFEVRVEAARSLWRALNRRPTGCIPRSMPPQLHQFHVLSLRALDARLCNESYRTIAGALFGFQGTKEDWESDSRKNKTRRLVAHGLRMMRGGYRSLLHYPIKPRDG